MAAAVRKVCRRRIREGKMLRPTMLKFWLCNKMNLFGRVPTTLDNVTKLLSRNDIERTAKSRFSVAKLSSIHLILHRNWIFVVSVPHIWCWMIKTSPKKYFKTYKYYVEFAFRCPVNKVRSKKKKVLFELWADSSPVKRPLLSNLFLLPLVCLFLWQQCGSASSGPGSL